MASYHVVFRGILVIVGVVAVWALYQLIQLFAHDLMYWLGVSNPYLIYGLIILVCIGIAAAMGFGAPKLFEKIFG